MLHLPCEFPKVLWDIRNQTYMPYEVVVALSETSLINGTLLEQSLVAELFQGGKCPSHLAGRPCKVSDWHNFAS
jgi:hypothetical protein